MLEDLGKMHNIWVAMAKNLGAPNSVAEDLVQEMYIRLNKYVKDPNKIYYKDTGEINRFYIWVTLRNMVLSYKGMKAKNVTFFLDDCLRDEGDRRQIEDRPSMDELEVDKELARDKIIQNIRQSIEEWEYWYDKKLFNLYYFTDMSMRDIARNTGISLTSIFNSCKNYRSRVLDKYKEDWEDFQNGEFDRI